MTPKVLRRIPLLHALPLKALRQVARICKTWDFPAGADIFVKADAANHLFIVLEGKIKVFTSSPSDKRKTFAYFGPGGFFGEMALLDGQERSASAKAAEPSRLVLIPGRDFRRLLLADAGLACFLLRVLSARLRKANEDIESLMFRNLLGRVSKTLMNLANAGGKRVGDGLLIKDRFTHQELADLVGTAREPLSRALSSLKRAELVSVREGRFFLHDTKRMRLLVGEPQG